MERLSDRLPDLGPRGEGWVAIQFGLFGLIGLAGTLGPDWGGSWRSAGSIAGAVLIGAALLFAVLGLIQLRPANLAAVPHPRQGGWLVDSGVYAIVRHPVYSGLIVAAMGWGLLTASAPALLLALVLGLFFDLKARREERWLIATYPAYADYRRRVRKLVPFVY